MELELLQEEVVLFYIFKKKIPPIFKQQNLGDGQQLKTLYMANRNNLIEFSILQIHISGNLWEN